MTNNMYDIAIVGGGLVGLTQAIMLAQADFNVICLDAAQGHQTADDRTTAISYGSSKILDRIGIWNDLLPHACPIKDIHILDGKSSTLLDFQSKDAFVDTEDSAFGWIIENVILKRILFEKIQATPTLTYQDNTRISDITMNETGAILTTKNDQTFHSKLIIGADGRRSFVRQFFNIPSREWDYNQTALVCLIDHEQPHKNIAIEHFRNDGPFAVLPLTDKNDTHRSSVVWSFHSKDGNWKKNAWQDNTELLHAALHERLPEFYGNITNISAIQFYPLTFNHAYKYISNNVVLIGDAAHGIHPIAGQGLNLGLRDVESLTDALVNNQNNINTPKTLEQYNQGRQADTISMAAATDLLNKLFSNNHKSISKIRKLGLKAVSKSKTAKLFFMKQAMGQQSSK